MIKHFQSCKLWFAFTILCLYGSIIKLLNYSKKTLHWSCTNFIPHIRINKTNEQYKLSISINQA